MVSEVGDIQTFLAQYPLFHDLPSTLIEDASNHIFVAFNKAGANISLTDAKHTPPVGLIIIKTGSVELRSPENQLIDKLSAGDYLIHGEYKSDGEMPTIRILEDSLYYELSHDAFERLLNLSPDFAQRCHNHLLSEKNVAPARPAAKSHTPSPITPEHEPNNGRAESHSEDFLLHRYVRDHMATQLVFVSPYTTILKAAQLMRDHNITSLLVRENAELVGIVTDRDFRVRVLAEGKSVSEPLNDVMTRNPHCIDEQALLYEAQTKMMTTGIHHLPVMRDGEVSGIITVSDIFRINNVEPLTLNKSIIAAQSVQALKKVSDKIPALMVKLAERDTRPCEIGEIITLLYDGITKRLLNLAEDELGKSPCSYAWLAFGSQARKEQVMGSDQDNALLLEKSLKGDELEYFAKLADFVCAGLDTCGIPFCSGDIMAKNPKWCQGLAHWQDTFSRWINERSPKAIMHASIFFDMRHIAGNASLTNQLHAYVLERAQTNTIFLALMCGNALTHSPPLGFFKNFVLENDGGHINTLDIKKRGTIPIVDIARNYALANNVAAVNTIERLKTLRDRNLMTNEFATSLIDAHEFIAGLRIESQANSYRANGEVSNNLDPRTLSPLLRHQLKEAFKFVKQAQSSMKNKFGGGYL